MGYIEYRIALSPTQEIQPAGEFTLFYKLGETSRPVVVGMDEPLFNPPINTEKFAVINIAFPHLYVERGMVMNDTTVCWTCRIIKGSYTGPASQKEISLGEFLLRSNSPVPQELIGSFYPTMGCVNALRSEDYREVTASALRKLDFTGDFGDHMNQGMKVPVPKKILREQRFWAGEIVAVNHKSKAGSHFEGIVLSYAKESEESSTYLIYATGAIDRVAERDRGGPDRGGKFDLAISMSSPAIHGRLLEIEAERVICRVSFMEARQEANKLIGVVTREGFSYDDKEFPALSFGRIVKIDGDNAEISWIIPTKYDLRGLREGPAGWGQRWTVSLERLNLCELKPSEKVPGFTVGAIFGSMIRTSGTPCFKVGDILYYSATSPFKYHPNHSVVRGTVLRVMRDFYDKPDYNSIVSLVGSASSPGAKEIQLTIQRRLVEPFPHTWFDRGKKVCISGQVSFKKKALAGLRGRVVTGTDIDGDVGVEFEADVPGAGSLDGAGKDGRCLFIPAVALAEQSE